MCLALSFEKTKTLKHPMSGQEIYIHHCGNWLEENVFFFFLFFPQGWGNGEIGKYLWNTLRKSTAHSTHSTHVMSSVLKWSMVSFPEM